MAEISRVAMFGKLNSLGYRAIESATVLCKRRGNPYVELVHWLHQILQLQDSDLHRIIRHFAVDPARLARDMTDALERLPRGSTSISDLSAHIEEAVERGWVYGTLMFGESQLRTGHLVVGIVKTGGLRNTLLGISREFEKIKVETLTDGFAETVGGSPNDALSAQPGAAHRASRRRDRQDRWIAQHASGHLARVRKDQGGNAHRRVRRDRRRLPGGRACGAGRVVAQRRRRARRGQRRDGARPDGQAGGPEAVHGRPDGAGPQGGDRPDRRPRRGDPADRRHPDAPSAAQHDPHGRSRRRPDRSGRALPAPDSSEETRVGTEWGSTC